MGKTLFSFFIQSDETRSCSLYLPFTFSNKYSYRRAMGIAGLGKHDKKENSGLCGKCRR